MSDFVVLEASWYSKAQQTQVLKRVITRSISSNRVAELNNSYVENHHVSVVTTTFQYAETTRLFVGIEGNFMLMEYFKVTRLPLL